MREMLQDILINLRNSKDKIKKNLTVNKLSVKKIKFPAKRNNETGLGVLMCSTRCKKKVNIIVTD